MIANLAYAPTDGRWTALDGRPLYSWLAPVGHLYEAHLRWELTRRLGVEWGPVRNGIADVAGIPKPVLREFSTASTPEACCRAGGHAPRPSGSTLTRWPPCSTARFPSSRPRRTPRRPSGCTGGWPASKV